MSHTASVTARPPVVFLIDDHAVLSEAMARALEPYGINDVHVAPLDRLGADDLLELAESIKPDVVLLDLFLGSAGLGTPLVKPLRALGAQVLVLSATSDLVRIGECLEAGAVSVLDKAMPFGELVDAIFAAAEGRQVLDEQQRSSLLSEASRRRAERDGLLAPFEALTRREQDVLVQLLAGSSPKQIAREQQLALPTIRTHIQNVLRKLGVSSQREALALVRTSGWAPPPHPDEDGGGS